MENVPSVPVCRLSEQGKLGAIDMTGTLGFLEELSFVLVPLLLLIVVAYFALRGGRTTGRPSFKGILACFVLILLPLVFGWKFIREIRAHWFLSHLRFEDVDSIYVDGEGITEMGNKVSIIQALNEAEWFAPHHGGWGKPVAFDIRLRSGEERHLQIAAYRLESGIVVDFSAAGGTRGIHPGYALCRSLISALKQSGIDLQK
jgi:hypothetical protein